MKPMDRRTTLVVLGGGLASAHGQHQAGHTAGENAVAYQPRFFTAEEFALLELVSELIIPADSRSPGARAARVAAHIDLVVANSGAAAQKAWKEELSAFANAAQKRFARPFPRLSASEQAALLDSLAANERKPATSAERFFAGVKNATIFAYYSSNIGLVEELGYQGNEVLAEFPGCKHGARSHREKF